MSNKELMKTFVCVFLFMLCILSYSTLAEEINDLATNVTTTNAILRVLDSTFGIFWALLCVFFLVLAIYFGLKA